MSVDEGGVEYHWGGGYCFMIIIVFSVRLSDARTMLHEERVGEEPGAPFRRSLSGRAL